jgi:C-terminal processing protease CtpA/Prc
MSSSNTKYIEYIKDAYERVFDCSIVGSKIDKEVLLSKGLEIAKHANSYEECYPALEILIQELKNNGDNHSHLNTDPKSAKKNKKYDFKLPESKLIDEIGYIKIPMYVGRDKDEIETYAQSLQSSIKELDSKGVLGWILDLREDAGGNMDPMIMGVGPLIERNPMAHFVFADMEKHSFGYLQGKYYYCYADVEEVDTVKNPVILKKQLPISVLIGNKTSSAGEALTISLMSERTKLFGDITRGHTTANASLELTDGRILNIATSQMMNYKEEIYSGPIKPDVYCNDEEIIEKASEWLLE